ncbi:TOG array regulator of axonemal microtubules protein 1-like [Astyanax mexicanus]|uniref:TOG array regulator of axonemal microtubules protein 1-like n=1 Tax=Astyanax mexicanus TaxID=7994 RepID=A0A8T2LZF4_ASTMX|nr:TOG array regulator of axonemal microtubules protein 1-like [Astyanax mexicanus]
MRHKMPASQSPSPPPKPAAKNTNSRFLPVATEPVVVNKLFAYNSPGSRIHRQDRQKNPRPVQAVVHLINNMAAQRQTDRK